MKKLAGTVVSLSGKQTAVVSIARQWRHPLYDKAVRRDKKYHCHYVGLELSVGDKVTITSSKPVSKLKRFKVVEKISN